MVAMKLSMTPIATMNNDKTSVTYLLTLGEFVLGSCYSMFDTSWD